MTTKDQFNFYRELETDGLTNINLSGGINIEIQKYDNDKYSAKDKKRKYN